MTIDDCSPASELPAAKLNRQSSVVTGRQPRISSSFRRVRRQFYDLVLKADVGVVDTSFTRTQSQTSEIQKVASQKEEELRALDQDFQPILKDVD